MPSESKLNQASPRISPPQSFYPASADFKGGIYMRIFETPIPAFLGYILCVFLPPAPHLRHKWRCPETPVRKCPEAHLLCMLDAGRLMAHGETGTHLVLCERISCRRIFGNCGYDLYDLPFFLNQILFRRVLRENEADQDTQTGNVK